MDTEKYIISFESDAKTVGKHVFVKANDVILSSSNAVDSPVVLQDGKTYRITIEEVAECKESRHDKFYVLLDEQDDSKRRCPECGSIDCKYAIHDFKHRGVDVSVMCNDCRYSESAIAPNYESIFSNWHSQI